MKEEKRCWTMEDVLQDSESRIRKQAQQILEAKEAGIHQESINKMLEWLATEKRNYDRLKQRYEGNGE